MTLDTIITFQSDGIQKFDILRNLETGEVHLVKNSDSENVIKLYPTWQAVIICLWFKVKQRLQKLFKRECNASR